MEGSKEYCALRSLSRKRKHAGK